MLQENLVDFNPFRGILSVSRESDRSNIHVERTVRLQQFPKKINNFHFFPKAYVTKFDLGVKCVKVNPG